MSDDLDNYTGEGKECRRCHQLHMNDNVVCGDCQDIIEGDDEEIKFFVNVDECKDCISKDKYITRLKNQIINLKLEKEGYED